MTVNDDRIHGVVYANLCVLSFTGSSCQTLVGLKAGCRHRHTRYALPQGLKRHGPTAWKAALLSIPRNLRTLYGHAYQSYLWNAAASHRVATYGVQGAVAGDLVLPPGGREAGADRSTARLEAVHKVTTEEADAGR